MEPAVDALIAHVEANVDEFDEPDADVLPSVSLDRLNRGEAPDDGSSSEEEQ